MGARPSPASSRQSAVPFQSTRPHGGATGKTYAPNPPKIFQSTRPHGGATSVFTSLASSHIHFNPRARMGARLYLRTQTFNPLRFQSTRPHGGATAAARGGAAARGISIHAPAWGRDSRHGKEVHAVYISIHAPAWGRDASRGRNTMTRWHFNPRARMGARHREMSPYTCHCRFQSTRPHGGATSQEHSTHLHSMISIHAPAWGRDLLVDAVFHVDGNFNPRARMGARPRHPVGSMFATAFQSTRPHGGATLPKDCWCDLITISIHAPAWGRDYP